MIIHIKLIAVDPTVLMIGMSDGTMRCHGLHHPTYSGWQYPIIRLVRIINLGIMHNRTISPGIIIYLAHNTILENHR